MPRSSRLLFAVTLVVTLAAACEDSNFAGGSKGSADAKGKGSGSGSDPKDTGSKPKLEKDKLTIPVGDKKKSKEKVDGCISENVKIAKCDPKTGEITGVAPGKTTIRVDLPDGKKDIVVTVTEGDGSGSEDKDDGSPGSSSDDADTDVGSGSGTASEPKNPAIEIDDATFACDKGQMGLVGKVYRLPAGTGALPNLDAMAPIGQIDATNLNVPPREWEDGFPALPGMIEWFAIKFFGQIEIPADGAYQFKTLSDDGSKLYIDDQLVVNNDGTHAPVEKESAPVTLTKGVHRLSVEWFQGPRVQIALQMFWKQPASGYEIIPAQVLKHGSDCTLQKLGTFP